MCNLRRHTDTRFCCSGCGRAFSAMTAFDWHRQGFVCSDPATARTGKGEPRWQAREEPGKVGTVTIWGRPGTWRPTPGPEVAEIAVRVDARRDEGPSEASPDPGEISGAPEAATGGGDQP